MQRLKCFFGYHRWGAWYLKVGFLETFYARTCPSCGVVLPNAVISHEEVAELIDLRCSP